jgi:hypothetical protein
MDYPAIAVDKKGHGYLVIDEGRIICTHLDLIEFAEDPPKDLKFVDFPVKMFVNHLLAGTCHQLYESAVIPELSKHMESYLMPKYMTKEFCQELLNKSGARPASAEAFFSFWAPPHLIKESEDMATKKATAAPAKAAKGKGKAPAAKAAPAKTAKGKAAAPVEGKAKKPGVGKFCMDLIEAGKTNDEILEAVGKQFPGAKTTKGCIAFYRNKLK